MRARSTFPDWLWLVVAWLTVGLAPGRAEAREWPRGYVVSARSISPDGRYGILQPRDPSPSFRAPNYLADLKAKRVLGRIAGVDCAERENHRWHAIHWDPASRWCVAEYGFRFGFYAVLVLRPTRAGFERVDVGRRVQAMLRAAIAGQAKASDQEPYAGAEYRLGPGQTLRVRAHAATNPKGDPDQPTLRSAFAGTYDLGTRRWLATWARPIGEEDEMAMIEAYRDFKVHGLSLVWRDNEFSETCPTEADLVTRLEELLARVLRVARVTLPPPRYAALDAEQAEWTKDRDLRHPAESERIAMTVERIKILQALLW